MPVPATPDIPARPLPLTTRIQVSLLIGLIVFGVSCWTAYSLYYRTSIIRYDQTGTLTTIYRVTEAIDAYQKEHHQLPTTLRELPDLPYRNEEGLPIDRWRRPLIYWTDGTHYRVTSYGRDGKPGGVGLDFDLTDALAKMTEGSHSSKGLPPQAVPTFQQFLTDRGGHYTGSGFGMLLMCVLTGIVTFILGLVTTRPMMITRSGKWGQIRRYLVIAAVTFLLAVMYLIPLHIPSGH